MTDWWQDLVGVGDNIVPDNLSILIPDGSNKAGQTLWNGAPASTVSPSSEERRALNDPWEQKYGPASNDMLNAKNDFMWQHGKKALVALGIKPLRFNAPLHPSLQKRDSQKSPYDLSHEGGDLRTDWPVDKGRKPWRWRLGQLVADAASGAYKDGEHRYGFRFLYNPTSIQFTSPLTGDFSPTAAESATNGMYLSPTGTMTMELLLNRIPDVTLPLSDKELSVGDTQIDPQDYLELKKRGTMYDIDYLYRTANGLWAINDPRQTQSASEKEGKKPNDGKKEKSKNQDKKNQKDSPAYVGEGTGWPYESGDIGMLLPTSMWLSIGRSFRYYGWIQSISYTHEMFSADMVPMLTRLHFTFQRILIGTRDEFKALNKASAVARNAEGNYFDIASSTGGGNNTAGGSPAAGYPDKQGKESNVEYVWYSLLRAGYSKAAAAGVLGNLNQESGVQYNNDQTDGPGMGLAQWTFNDRWQNLLAWCKKKNYDVRSGQGQVGFMLSEMAAGWQDFNPKAFMRQSDPEDAAYYFHREFEVSNDSRSEIQERLDDARRFYNNLKDKDLPTTGGTGSASSSGNSLWVVGDSLTVGSASYIQSRCKRQGIDVTIAAENGRHLSEGVNLATSDVARKSDVVIIALGTNDYENPDEIRKSGNAMMDNLGSKTVLWINVSLPDNPSATRKANNAIESVARNYSNLGIIDFAGQVKNSYFANDGVHLTANGYKWRAGLYVPSGMGSSSAVSQRVGN